jgi:Flp pilus assembly protein TadG
MARPFSRRAGRPRTRGQALVEVALVLPLFLLLLMTLFDFGRLIYIQHTINQDAREGVRRGIVSTDGLTAATFPGQYAAIRAAARVLAPGVPMTDAAIFGADALGGCAIASDTPPAPADTCFYPLGVTAPNATVVVRIRVTVNFITPIIGNIFGSGITIQARAEQLIQS